MGQLEKYGLYVLCLVIFLILGVAIWGEPASAGGERAPRDGDARTASPMAPPVVDLSMVGTGSGATVPLDAVGNDRAVDPGARNGGVANLGNGTNGTNGTGAQPKDPGTGSKPEPKPAARPKHVVADGESFDSIARKQLGDVRFVALLQDLNPTVEPKRMKVGMEIVLPTAAEREAQRQQWAARTPASPTTVGAREHRIEKGDTLAGLAKRYLGKESRVDEIQDLNPTVDPTRLRIGQVIRLPAR